MAFVVDAQTTPTPPAPQNSPIGSSVECPGGTSSYSVPINVTDGSDPAKCFFEWQVYGGTITSVNGTIVTPIHTTPASGTTQTISTVKINGIAPENNIPAKSKITIQWDTPTGNAIAGAWIAVRQSTQWGCSDNKWSIINVSLGDNTAPTVTTKLSDITTCADNDVKESATINYIKFDGSNSTTYSDNCTTDPKDLVVTYSIVVKGTTTIIRSGTGSGTVPPDAGGEFPEGTSTVTYTVTDKAGNQTSKSFDITVNHMPHMSNIN